ncbi:MAG: zinc ribbon domain-containing protein [Dehalococcoidia bacterium]|nr:zinc ribbon domain-containing protein [Dehalococcoidia bacterium]MDD5495008.1 zinc ribbon domain-containing protein [Dehalococcoidia bacterium]
MPLYEYSCPNCKNKFELLRPISCSDQNAECPKCKSSSKRTISKFISRASYDLGDMPSMTGSGSSCSSCSSSNCSSCGQ